MSGCVYISRKFNFPGTDPRNESLREPLRNDCLGPSGLGSAGRPAWSGANAPKTVFPTLLMPVHTYYTSSGSWLVPVIKARLTDAAAVAPCGPVCIGSVRERVLTGAIVTANTDNLQEVYLPQQLGFQQMDAR